jgi:hypothetical protein
MGYSRNRPGQDGKPRYTAYYWDLRGRECSAGTFRRKKDADRAWQAAEARVAGGRATDLRRGAAAIRGVRDRDMAAQPRHGAEHAAELHLRDQEVHPA